MLDLSRFSWEALGALDGANRAKSRVVARDYPQVCHSAWVGSEAMGRPRVSDEDRVVTAVRLPESIHARLHREADERDVSANMIITKAVEFYLDRLPSLGETLVDPSLTPRSARRAKARR